MKFFVASAAVSLLCAVPAVSEHTKPLSIPAQIVAGLPAHLRGLQHHALADSTIMSQYAVASVTIASAEKSFGESAARLHSETTVAELLAAYQQANRSPVRLDASASRDIEVLALDEFVTGPVTYDWIRLNRTYPNVKAVLRLSQPAIAGGYALVRLEMIGEGGKMWGSFLEFQRNPSGEWKYARSVAGNLWE